jgi:hypothetical protein
MARIEGVIQFEYIPLKALLGQLAPFSNLQAAPPQKKQCSLDILINNIW